MVSCATYATFFEIIAVDFSWALKLPFKVTLSHREWHGSKNHTTPINISQ